MTEEDQANQRRVRPWIAALLTFLGPGVGLFYARRTRAAIWFVAILIVISVALAVGAYVYMTHSNTVPRAITDPETRWLFDLSGVAITALMAIGVWIYVAPRQHVQKGGPLRLFGYLAIFIVPLLLQFSAAMALRFTLAQPFRAPSGSMQPTINVGDYMLVSKGSYGYSRFSAAPFQDLLPHGRWRVHEPQRGDIVVFRPPSEPDRDFVKRIVGLPGDRLRMIDGVLHINGAPVQRENLGEQSFDGGDSVPFSATVYRETLPNGVSYLTLDRGEMELDNTREYVVPAGSYFMMGDDRDNSADSRVYVGFVPFENLVGRVDRILPPA